MEDLKKRFVSEYKLPLSVFEQEYWDYFLNLYGVRRQWEDLLAGIDRDYGGNADLFLKAFYELRDSLLADLHEKIPEEFNGSDKTPGKRNILSPYYDVPGNYSSRSIYSGDLAGEVLLSVDLRKANIQALRWYEPSIFPVQSDSIDEVYQGWLDTFKTGTCLDEYVRGSKYLRQVVFGNLNPKRQVRVEKFLISKVIDKVGLPVVSLQSDEVVFKTDEIPDCKVPGLDVKVERFILEEKKFLCPSGNILKVYRRRPISSISDLGEIGEYRCIPRLFYSQVYQWIYGIDPDPKERDLVFYCEKELAKFLGRIKPINDGEK